MAVVRRSSTRKLVMVVWLLLDVVLRPFRLANTPVRRMHRGGRGPRVVLFGQHGSDGRGRLLTRWYTR